MEKNNIKQGGLDESRKLALAHMQMLVEMARESFLILDSSLRVIVANPIFYERFHVLARQTENVFLYDLGNGQWNIPGLRKLLEEILPEKKIVKDYEVEHIFELIGKKTILLNARRLDSVKLIILAMEDITERKDVERKLADYTRGLEDIVAERTGRLAERIKELENLNQTMINRELKMVELKKEIDNLKKRLKNGNGKNGNGKNGNGNGNHNNGRKK
jgi:chemotaxis protein methyltransferase CheR